MSKQEKPRKRLWPFAGLCAVTGMWAVSAAANWWAGFNLSNDLPIAHILGAASICSDIMKAVALFVVVAATMNRRWMVAGVGLLVFALCATWSMRSATYFASSFLTQHVAQRGHDKQLQDGEMALLKIKQDRLKWLQGTDLNVDNPGKTQLQMLTKDRSDRSAEFKQLSAEVEAMLHGMRGEVVTPNSDPLASIFNLSDQTVVLWTALFFAALLEVVSGVGFWMIAQARLERAQAEVKDEPVGFGGRGFGGGRGPSSPTQPPPASAKPVAASPVVQLRAHRGQQLRDKVDDIVDQVIELHPGSRMKLSQIVGLVNQQLPRRQQLSQHQQRHILVPALLEMDGVEKRRNGGCQWVHGVQKRGQLRLVRAVG